MAVITISRQLGSNGAYIAQQIADALGYRFVDKQTFEDVLEQYGLIQLNDLYRSAPGFWARFDDTNLQLIFMLNKIILAFAHFDNTVILGRGGFAVLLGYADVLNVRIQAPLAVRAQRVLEREHLADMQSVEELILVNDKARSTFLQAFYNVEWDAAPAFNLILDTSVVSSEQAVSWIVDAARSMRPSVLGAAPTTRQIVVDAILSEAINSVLKPAYSPD